MSVLMPGSSPRIKTRKNQSLYTKGKEALCQGGNVQYLNLVADDGAPPESYFLRSNTSTDHRTAASQMTIPNDVSK